MASTAPVTADRAHRGSSPRSSPLWMAAGAGLIGATLGGLAVYLGAGLRAAPASEVVAPPVPATLAAPAPQPEPRPAAEAPAAAPPTVPTLAEAVAATRDAVVSIGAVASLGAGVIVDAEGTIVTNFHVIEDALRAPKRGSLQARGGGPRPTVSARFEDGRELPALVVVADAEQDLAILRLIAEDDEERFASVELGSSEAAVVGLEVFAIGNPFGLSHTVSRGIISATGRTSILPNRVPLMQLDASINVGNSGGPLFDRSGQLLGIVTAKRREGQGIAFAVPVDHLRGFLRAVSDPSSGRRSGAIGITLEPRAELPEAARTLGFAAGVVLTGVEDGSPALAAGLVAGDILVALGGKRLDGMAEAGDPSALGRVVVASVRSLFAGEMLEVAVVRDGVVVTVSVEVGTATPERQALIDAEELLGLSLLPHDGEARATEGGAAPEVSPALPGLQVAEVSASSPLASVSDRLTGARVVKVMNRDIHSTAELGEELARVRAFVRTQRRAVQLLIGFADGHGDALGEVHVVVG